MEKRREVGGEEEENEERRKIEIMDNFPHSTILLS